MLGRIFDDLNLTVGVADDHALAHVEEQTMLQHAEHAGQLGVNVLNVKACAEVQIRDEVAVIGNEGLAVAYTAEPDSSRKLPCAPSPAWSRNCAISTGRWKAPILSTSLDSSMIQITSFAMDATNLLAVQRNRRRP